MARNRAARAATFAILKGGVGKTTQTALIADACVRLGLDTLVIDADSQANLTRLLGNAVNLVEGEVRDLGGRPVLVTDRYTLEDVMSTESSDGLVRHAVQDATWAYPDDATFERGGPLPSRRLGRLGILPSYAGLEVVSQTWKNADLRRLRDGLYEADPVDGIVPATEWDVILIDSPPAPGALARLAVGASDQVVIVCEATDFAVDAVKNTLTFLKQFQAGGYVQHPIGIAGVAMNGWEERLLDQQANVERLVEILDAPENGIPGGYEQVLWPEAIPDRTVVGKAATAHQPVSAWLRARKKSEAETATEVCMVAEQHALILAEVLGVPDVAAIRAEWEQVRQIEEDGGEAATTAEHEEMSAHA